MNPEARVKFVCHTNKWKLFKKDGYRISRALRSGQDDFDSNLHLVRMDRLVRISFHTLII